MKKHVVIICIILFCLVLGGSLLSAGTFYSSAQSPDVYTKSKYGLFNKITGKEGKGEELLAILLKASKLVAKVEGCNYYMVSRDQKNEDTILIYEVWDSKEHHGNSLKLPEVRELIGQAIPILEGNPSQIATFDVIGGKGFD